MHRLTKFTLEKQCNDYVLDKTYDIVEDLVYEYNKDPTTERFVRLLSNTPMGLNLTARITTNYLQLKGIYKQRRNHRLPEWQQFCDWVETLPYMSNILQVKQHEA